jgi:hypothetical protein
MTSKIVVNNIEADSGINTITFINEVTAPTFNGNITGTAATFTTGTFSGNVDIAGALTYEDVTNVDSVGIVTARSGIHVTGGNVGIGTDNPISNLQVFGTNGIRITNSANQNATTLLNFESNHPAFRMLNVSGDTTVKFKSDGDSFITSGNLGIGTDNPGHILDLYNSVGTDCLRLNVNGNAGGSNKQNAIRFSVDGSVIAHMGLAVDAGRLISGSTANDFCLKGIGANHILFATNSNERLGIRSDGAVTIGNASNMGSNYARLSIDCEGRNVIADTTDITKYGLAFHNDPTNDAANGIGFFNDSGNNCGGYILHQDKGSNNLGDLVFGTAESSNSPQERLRITANGRLIQSGFVTTSVHRRTGSIVAGTYTFGTVSDAFAGILYVTGTHNNGHSTRMYIINKSTNGTGVTLVGDGNNYSPARVDITLSGNNLQGQVYYGNKPVLQMITLRGSYTHTLAES